MESFKGPAVLELFGHRQLAGYVDEVEIAGKRMLRVAVPCRPGTEETREAEGWPAVRIFGADAIYSLTPCTAEYACRVAEQLQPRYTAPARQLGDGRDPDGFDDDDEDDLDDEDDDPADEEG